MHMHKTAVILHDALFCHQSYADNMQVYCLRPLYATYSAINTVDDCISDIKKLNPNDEKTEVLLHDKTMMYIHLLVS